MPKPFQPDNFECYAIPNHVAGETSLINPVTFSRPELPKMSKLKYRQWCRKASTNFAFISACDGVSPHLRINPTNPPCKARMLICDYDSPAPEDFVAHLQGREKLHHLPTFAHTTPSGCARLIWVFEEPTPVPEDSARAFLEEVGKTVGALGALPALDSASYSPTQYFDIGGEWVQLAEPLEQGVVLDALFRAVSKRTPAHATIPMEQLEEEVHKQFPGRWDGPFEPGARGPLFWIDDGVDRPGALVCEDGMLCFSDRAGAGFLHWGEIFGQKFVRQYEEKKLFSAGENIYYDGKRYYEFDDRGRVFGLAREDLVLRFKDSGLSATRSKKARLSEVEQALLWVQRIHRIHTVAPILHDHNRVVEVNGCVVLNSRSRAAVRPADNGDPSKWPWLHEFYENFFESHDGLDPKDFFFAWLQRAYFAMHYGRLLSGQAVILVGPTGRGKTLNSNIIVGGLLGGAVTASDFLQSRSIFNKELAENPLWAIDDATAPPNGLELRKYTENLKKYVANPHIEVRAMYRDPQRVPFGGRIMITLNPDPNSLSLIPALDQSNRDKLMAFKIRGDFQPRFKPNHEQEEIIRKELPHFARFLLDWTPPEYTVGEARYGVQSIYHPDVIDAARDNSSRSAALEAIEVFVKVLREGSEQKTWTGTTTELMSQFGDDEQLRSLSIGRNHLQMQMGLNQAEESYRNDPKGNRPVTSRSSGRGKHWTIDLDEKYDDHPTEPITLES